MFAKSAPTFAIISEFRFAIIEPGLRFATGTSNTVIKQVGWAELAKPNDKAEALETVLLGFVKNTQPNLQQRLGAEKRSE